MTYSISTTTSGNANVIIAYESNANAIGLSIAIDYSDQIAQLVSAIKDLRDDIRTLKQRASNANVGIVVSTVEWPKEGIYNSTLTEFSLRDSNTLTAYNQLVVSKGGTPI